MGRVVAAALAAAAIALHAVPLQARTMLAPNGEGYQMSDSAERYGPDFDRYEDISADGTRLVLGDDESAEIRFGFEFVFYGQKYYTARVSSNGYITFGDTLNDSVLNRQALEIPQQSGTADWQSGPFIAPWFADLNPEAGGAVYYKVSGAAGYRVAVIQWRAVHHDDTLPGSSPKFIEFQARLHEGSYRILFKYNKTAANDPDFSNGRRATVGIQGDGSTGINYSNGTAAITDELVIGFVPRKYGYVGVPTPPAEQSGAPGSVITHEFEVINGKNKETDFHVQVLPGARWKVELAQKKTGPLAPGESKRLAFNVTVPESGGAALEDDLATIRVIDLIDEDSNSSGSTTNTQNNQQITGAAPINSAAVWSLINLRSRCEPFSCFQADRDGDGVVDGSESAASAGDASRVEGFAVRSGALFDFELDGEGLDAETAPQSVKGVFYGLSTEAAVDGPKGLAFPEGVINVRVRPYRAAEYAMLVMTPPKAWPEEMVLYLVDAEGKFFAADEKLWKPKKAEGQRKLPPIERLALTLVDGGNFDGDGTINGVISLRMAMGVTPVAESKDDGFGGALLTELLLLGAFGVWRYAGFRRRPRP